MLVCNAQITEAQQQALAALIACCRLTDGEVPVIYHRLLQQKRNSKSNFFFYHDEDLLGFLSAYYFYENACEISLLVSPTQRCQGIAKQLLRAILPVLEKKHMQSVIFSMAGLTQNDWLKKYGFVYKQSDYHMVRTNYEPIFTLKPSLVVRKAQSKDIERLCELDAACFPHQEANTHERFMHLLDDKDYTLFVGLLDDRIIGKAHINWQDDGASFSDIAIEPTLQGKGFGSQLLTFCINYALVESGNHLSLNVETTNKSALHLYQRLGFQTAKVHEYWQISLNNLKKALNCGE